ncbi:hypothetical protein A4X13_0g9548 [Tilletia indica]|uniref:Uncharacterized protein n=1 Tax=Tilletia indica TaxID=43049 RepID=A0A8T8S8X0_9BASI|nr:hypothetical protein A4X13_0g9548 [Tilletia indica]
MTSAIHDDALLEQQTLNQVSSFTDMTAYSNFPWYSNPVLTAGMDGMKHLRRIGEERQRIFLETQGAMLWMRTGTIQLNILRSIPAAVVSWETQKMVALERWWQVRLRTSIHGENNDGQNGRVGVASEVNSSASINVNGEGVGDGVTAEGEIELVDIKPHRHLDGEKDGPDTRDEENE